MVWINSKDYEAPTTIATRIYTGDKIPRSKTIFVRKITYNKNRIAIRIKKMTMHSNTLFKFNTHTF